MSTSPSLQDNSDGLFLEQNPVLHSLFSLTGQASTGRCDRRDNLFAPLPVGEFEVFYADPPWDYKGQHQHNGAGGLDTGGANRHYPTVTLKDLKRLNIQSITAENALLFMWSSSPHLDQAIELGKSWGFAWATIGFVWNKMRTNPGFYSMSQCEVCLLFKHGKIPAPRGARNVRQYVEVVRESHSKKPEEVRNRICQMFPTQRKIELFARERVPGWKVWGNQV